MKVTDAYVNRAFIEVTMSAANTLTFEQIRFSVGTFEGYAILLHQIHFYPTETSLRELVAATDDMTIAVVTRDSLTSLDPTEQSVISVMKICSVAAGVESYTLPLVMDFTALPEKSILIAPNPLYIAMTTSGAVAASKLRAVMYYRFKKLSAAQALELLQMMIPANT